MALAGVVDGFFPNALYGWAFDSEHADLGTSIALEVNDAIVTTFACDILRKDLAAKNMGSGRYGFSINPVRFLVPGVNRCRVLFAGTDRTLGFGTRVLIAPRRPPSPSTPPLIDPEVAWNEPGQIAAFFRGTSAPNMPQPRFVHVLGLFNSGTNYLAHLLAANAVFGLRQEDHDMQYKHYPLGVLGRLARRMSDRGRLHTINAVSTRDPFRWIDAMRKSPYQAEFGALDAPVSMPSWEGWHEHRNAAGYKPIEWARTFHSRNIVDYWNRYHAEWIENGAREVSHAVLIRYEDMVTQPCEIVRVLRAMLRVKDAERIVVNVATAKVRHATPGSFWNAKRKLMLSELGPRYTAEELAFISRNLSAEVCNYLGYDRDEGAPLSSRRICNALLPACLASDASKGENTPCALD